LLDSLVNIAIKYRARVDHSLMMPTVNWREPNNERNLHKREAAVASHVAVAGEER
jgi:hypothetical protein